ncbi:hypothetical protein CDQ84_08275 [Clostridium thermosuccinogenes]|uniref:PD-(D/E)XK endonuclease-like domain-containing protein n=1 Tax=Clostridium thermosuccinogenes TaxID=84032 RepID=A0A2K2FFK6_9CLOT|nr:PD-(D/E)XK nuclease family protein [Pseudoclostridium thermosuccinogenes]AUS96655.1 hypothetical protein CDO33_09515 [Pseudoclostridium thermosuccinogenes]PNT97571.1 hypothetical protein CDQ85_08120 [Pseudoclostridium thermosuccinogenes]PNT99567.1 hypothetical protein CDQ84_08275 [Pseudoclostridium thermosuccinogenes]
MDRDLRLADHFLYTQHSLATFDNCPLKFKKRYLENLKWDSFPDEATRKSIEAGNNFHLLAYRYFMGIETAPVEALEKYPELSRWMESLMKRFNINPEFKYLPEYKLRMSSGEMKLEANFDLLIVKHDHIEIWDWKTHGGRGKVSAAAIGKKLRSSLQTMVYMYALKEQSRLVAGEEIKASNISMHYWQPEPAMTLAEIKYSDALHEHFGNIIREKIRNILNYDFNSFDKDMYSKHCRVCEFNWFCNNERVDFSAMQEDEDIMLELDWERAEEVY